MIFFDKISDTISSYKILKKDEKRRIKLEEIEKEREAKIELANRKKEQEALKVKLKEQTLKEEAKLGSAGLVMAIVGGALMPPVQATILDWGGPGFSDIQILGFIDEVNFSFIMPLFGLLVVTIYSYRSLKILR